MKTFLKKGKYIEITDTQEIKTIKTKRELRKEKQDITDMRANLKTRLDEVNALLAQCDTLGVEEEIIIE